MPGLIRSATNYFRLSKGELRGISVLAIIIFILILVNIFLPVFLPSNHAQNPKFKAFIEQFEKDQQIAMDSIKAAEKEVDKYYQSEIGLKPLRQFNPNTLDNDAFKKLGFSDHQIAMITKYRNNGGIFKNADDFSKIYSISEKEFKALKPYIEIPDFKTVESQENKIELALEEFDPNTVSLQKLQKMGIEQSVSQTIINYRASGGHFNNPEDLKKLYTMPEELYHQLLPFIKIKPTENIIAEIPIKEKVVLDLNSADSLDLQQLKGIGPSYARRIIKYRDLLGGYVDVSQLLEVYGMDSLKYAGIADNLAIETINVKQININDATIKQLIKHPYIEFYIAKSIVNHRDNNGTFVKLEELKDARLMYPELYEKIAPYLTISK